MPTDPDILPSDIDPAIKKIGNRRSGLPGCANEVENRCPAMNLFRGAGVDVTVNWETV